tara:strand:+ start:951 stop:1454 length:504 start_codon:yes stop_codon:yes gene_type:complete
MAETKTLILNPKEVDQKIKRIAHQILEEYHIEKKIIFAGISKNGFLLAKHLCKEFQAHSNIKVELTEILINKEKPLSDTVSHQPKVDLKNQTVILIDDVLNSGKTLMYAASHIIDHNIRRMNTIVLIDRRHRKFPIKADWVGLTLSTTLQEHITVEFLKTKIEVYLH